MAKNKQSQELTRLGLIALIPLIISAAALWLSPAILPQHIALDFHQIALAAAAIFIVFFAGAGFGTSIGANATSSPLPNILITLLAFLAILPNGVFFLALGAAQRHFILLVLMIYLLARDLATVSGHSAPRWYGTLRIRLTFWAGISIILIISRLLLWGYY
ncbi:DUF3429 family protein [Hyphococcus sp. DH-69]|uniref:DUF3429 family protein n=1 Tax=Hyphococcus formosus TaxID=3143534 RepID=UPI00398B697B